jgi:ABC-type microcin C transport system duplicated ATPase subunit YejF
VLRLIEPTSGTVRFDGTDLLALDGGRCAAAGARCSDLQDPFGSLNPRLRIGAIVGEG